MSDARVELQRLSEDERDLVATAFALVEEVFRAVPMMLILEDEKGVFLHFPNGHEIEIMHHVATMDWGPTTRVIEETCTQ